jgi:hypothetical protein
MKYWGCPCCPKKYVRSTSVKSWGCPEAPLLHRQNIRSSFKILYFLLLRILCVFLRASLFLLSVFFCFVCCNKWLHPNIFLLEKTHSVFHCQEHCSLHSLSFNKCSLFLVLRLAFIFHFDFCSELVVICS